MPEIREIRECYGCGREYTPTKYWQRFHNHACQRAFHNEQQRQMRQFWREKQAEQTEAAE